MGRKLFAVVIAHSVLIQIVTFVLRPTATYRAIELGVPAGWLGALGAGFALAPFLLAVPSGQAVDRLGERRVAVGGAVVLLAAAVVYAVAGHGVVGLLVATVLLGIGHLGSAVSGQALIANTPGRGGHDSAFGHYTFSASLGQALGPLVIVAVGGTGTIPDTSSIFVCGVAVAAAALVASAFLTSTVRDVDGDTAAAGGFGELLRRPGLLRALTVSCVMLVAVDITLVYLPALGAERGLAAGAVALLLTVRGVASMASRLFLGRMTARLGRRAVMVGSAVLAAVGIGLTVVPMPVWLLGVVMLAVGFGLGAGQPLTMSWLAESTPPGLRGRAMSLRLAGNRAGQLVVPSLVGFAAAGLGAGGVLVATAAGLAAAGMAARRFDR